MKQKTILIIFLLLFFTSYTSAQNKGVSDKVASSRDSSFFFNPQVLKKTDSTRSKITFTKDEISINQNNNSKITDDGVQTFSSEEDVDIPDNGGWKVWFTNNSFAPSGAIVIKVEYRLRIKPKTDANNFYCQDYEVWLSSSNANDAVADVNVYDNLGGRTDENHDDDADDDSDIYLNWRETNYFNGEDANQYWGVIIRDKYTNDEGTLDYLQLKIYWSTGASMVDVDPDVEYIEINGSQVNPSNSITIELTNPQSDYFMLELRGENDGSDAATNGTALNFSVEEFTSSSYKNNIIISNHSSDLDANKFFGSEVYGGDGYADYVMVEGNDANWVSNESNYLRALIYPGRTGRFTIHYRMTLNSSITGDDWLNDPSSSGSSDPIGEPSYQIHVDVITPTAKGDVEVTVKNIDNTSVPYPGSNGIGVLMQSTNAINTDETNNNGVFLFQDIPYGNGYFVNIYHDPSPSVFGLEYWGKTSDFNLDGNESMTFTRYMPYAQEIKLYKDGSQISWGSSVESGSNLTVKVTVRNNGGAFNVKSRLIMDRSKGEAWDYDITSLTKSIAYNTSQNFEFNWSPSTEGTYYVIPATLSYVDGGYKITDSWYWGDVFFTVEGQVSPPDINVRPTSLIINQN